MSTLGNLLERFTKFRADTLPSNREGLPLVDKDDEIVTKIDSSDQRVSTISQLNEFRTIADDRETQYNTYDEMSTDSVIAAALEIYADDATAYDEQGRVIWVESDEKHIADAGNRLLDKLNIPERAWKHIYQACKYGDYYLKIYRRSESDDEDPISSMSGGLVKVINDVVDEKGSKLIYPYDMYVEDVYDPATVFDLRKRGKTAGFIEVTRDLQDNTVYTSANVNNIFMLKDVNVYKPDRMVHIMISENLTRTPETVTISYDEDKKATYEVARGKSILYDVYPIQRELQLLEDSLLLNRLTRSSLIRLLEIEVGDMPKKEVNDYLRRMKNLIEQHIAMDKNVGSYKSYNSPGPIDNVIYIPVKNGKGHIDINNLGGDVNVRDIADIDYFNNKRSGALKIPRSFLGDDGEGCLRGSTEILLLNGQRRGIGYLYEHRDEYIGKGIMSCNSDGSLLPTKIKDIKQTRKDAKFVRVHLDNGKYFDVTPDHLCMIRDGSFREAQDLEVGSSLMPMYDRELGGLKKSAPYNHKVVQVEFLDVVEDAYDLQVESDNHTFLLSSGVFVHNSQLDNGGTLTQLSIRYARTIKRIQTSYINAITTLLNLFFIDMDLDYINKFQVRMTSPSTQEDIARNELINGNIDLISSIMSLTESLEGGTQKEILEYLINNILKMPEVADIINTDTTPEDEVAVDGDLSTSGPDVNIDLGGSDDLGTLELGAERDSNSDASMEFTDDEFSSFEDEL